MSCMPNMPEIPNMPEMPGAADGPGKTAADVQKGNVRVSAGAEADHDIDISAGTFDMEGVVWGAKEAQEGKKDREETPHRNPLYLYHRLFYEVFLLY